MGISSALSIATAGLGVTQSNLDVVARNIANAGSPGYTRKVLAQSSTAAGGGVRALDVQRTVDSFLQARFWTETAGFANVDMRNEFLARIDAAFGAPGGANALDTVLNTFSESLQGLATSPQSFAARQGALQAAQSLAQQLNSLSGQVQSLRQLAEDGIGAAVADVNGILEQLAKLNGQLSVSGGNPPPDLLDERDRLIGTLSGYLDIRVSEKGDGTVGIATVNGLSLLDVGAAKLSFDGRAALDASSLYSTDAAERGVGTITIQGANGYSVDLIQSGGPLSGSIGAYVELRDRILTQTQAQLDELAHGLALSLSSKATAGTAASSGSQAGFDIDTAGLAPGDRLTLTYRETPPGVDRRVSIIRVDDPAALPLGNDATAEAGDRVIGISFAGGMAKAVAAIQSALGPSFTVSNPAGSTLRVLDDGAAGQIDIARLSSTVASQSLSGDGAQLALFVDASRGTGYTASFDGGSQKLGFAARIGVNAAVLADNELLVRYQTSPETPLGDATRPAELLSRLTETLFTFSSATGIGQSSRPFAGSVSDFARSVIGFQTAQSAQAASELASKQIVVEDLQGRIESQTGVDVDAELTQLLALQNAYAANARVIQVASELMRLLLEL